MHDRRTGWRLAGSLALAGLAFLTLQSGFDRMAAQQPGLARLVAEPFQGEAAKTLALQAIMRGEPDAPELANDAVRASPAEASSLALVGVASLQAGDGERAATAFTLAARGGWRDRATQLYWFEAARGAGDWPNAALRADALMRADPRFPGSERMLAAIEEDARGRAAWARRLAAAPPWRSAYLAPDISGEGSRELLRRRSLVLLEEQAPPADCGSVEPFVRNALQAGERGVAQAVWNRSCPDLAVGSGLIDPDFARAGQGTQGAFGWHRYPSGDVTVVFEGEGDTRRLVGRNRSARYRKLAGQALSLPQGRYRFEVRLADGDADDLRATLPCADAQGGNAGDGIQPGQVLTVGDCTAQQFDLWLRGGTASVIESVMLRPL